LAENTETIYKDEYPLFDILLCMSNVLDLVSTAIADHHKRVAYIALSLAEKMKLSDEKKDMVFIAALLHDTGAISLKEKLGAFIFEVEKPYRHVEAGYLLFKKFSAFDKIAEIIRCHHTYWEEGRGAEILGEQVPLESHLIHLADRISVIIDKNNIIKQSKIICKKIEENRNKMFKPDILDVFLEVSQEESFWLNLISPECIMLKTKNLNLRTVNKQIDFNELLQLSRFFCKIIDFRSRFTAAHSYGVGIVAEKMAELFGLAQKECLNMRIAGYLHDLGKLAVPIEIIEKPGKLTTEEFDVIKTHPYHTYRLLKTVKNLEKIAQWAAFHHERPDGSGYPFNIKAENLSLNSKIIAVSDTFNAITEDRPYRKSIAKEPAIRILNDMVKNNILDANVVEVLENNYDVFNALRESTQKSAYVEYSEFETELANNIEKYSL